MVDLKVQSAILVDALKLNLNMFLSHAQSVSERQTDRQTCSFCPDWLNKSWWVKIF